MVIYKLAGDYSFRGINCRYADSWRIGGIEKAIVTLTPTVVTNGCVPPP